MKILMSGTSGFIGSWLISKLSGDGHEVTRLVRSRTRVGLERVFWDPYAGFIEGDRIGGTDAVIHLAGKAVSEKWTEENKKMMRDSRIETTRFLSRTIAAFDPRPKVMVCASAMGYYGDRGDERLTEESGPGAGFFPDLCRDWEEATEPARKVNIRVVNLRLGMVLGRSGGAIGRMIAPFRLGLGGVIGSGKQYWSWIAIDDVVGAIDHILSAESLEGPVNVVAPGAVTNREFTRALGKVLSRPTWFPIPAFAVRMIFGEMADSILLASARVEPAKLLASGYRFRLPELEGALRHLLR